MLPERPISRRECRGALEVVPYLTGDLYRACYYGV